MPPIVATVTEVAAAALAFGGVTLMLVALSNITAPAATVSTPLNETVVVPLMNPVPVRVISFPPVNGPEVADKDDNVGMGSYWYVIAGVLVPPNVETVTETAAAALAFGGVTLMLFAPSNITAPAATVPTPLNETVVAPLMNPVPVRVITEPPTSGPEVADMLAKVGGGM